MLSPHPFTVLQDQGAAAQNVSVGHVASTATVHAPAKLNLQARPAVLASGAQVHAPTMTQTGPQTIEPALVASGAVVHAPTISTAVTVPVGALASGAVVRAPTFSTAVTVQIGHLASGSQVHAPTVTDDEEPEPEAGWVPALPILPTEGRNE